MSDNMDDMDMDQDDLAMDSGFDDDGLEDFEGGVKTSFGDMARENPLVKIGIVLAAFATIIGGVILFGGGGKKAEVTSYMQGGGGLSAPPGSEETSEAYTEALKEKNRQHIEEAVRSGTSAMPTPITIARDRLELEKPAEQVEDPLERWRRLQKERQESIAQQQKVDTKQEEVDHTPSIEALAEAMSAQMSAILGTLQPEKAEHLDVTSVSYLEEKRKREAEEAKEKEGDGEEGTEGQDPLIILLPAGTIEYAQLMTEATSDAPGPIMAQLVSGPLRGSRLIGDFRVEDEYLTLNFNTVVIDGISHKMKAVALDPETVTPGMVTEYDPRYFKRVILPAAAAFISGYGDAVAQAGTSTVNVTTGGSTASTQSDLSGKQELFSGLGDAAESISKFIDDEAKSTKPLVRVAAGTPIGLMFVEPVTKENTDNVIVLGE